MSIEERNISRRTFLKGAAALPLLLGGCSFFPSVKRAADNLTSRCLPGTALLRQLITARPDRSRVFMWQSAAAQPEATVAVRWRGGSEVQTFPAVSIPYTDDRQQLHLQTVTVDGLQAGTAYDYQLRHRGESSDWYPFSTAAPGRFKALIFPDTQCNDYSVWAANAKKAAAAHPDADFFVNMGDLVDNGEDSSQWNAWFDAVQPLLETRPFVPVMGNHETYDRRWEVRVPTAYLSQFAVPPNGCDGFDRFFYSFDWGEVHFVVLNTQWDELSSLRPQLLSAQQEWLRLDVARSRQRWKVALFHKDVLKYAIKSRPERQAGISGFGQALAPLLEELGFDLVLTAHLHTYRNRGRLKAFQPSETGPAYVLTGVAGNIFYNDFWLDHPLDQRKAPQPETGNYLTLTAEAGSLHLESFLFSGQRFDELYLRKNPR